MTASNSGPVRSLRRYLRFGLGSALAAISTYLLFLSFAHAGDLEDLGRYGVIAVLVAAMVNFTVTVPEQRIIQAGVLEGHRGRMGAYMRGYTLVRAGLILAVAGAAFLMSWVVTTDLCVSAAVSFCFLGQGLFGIALGPRVLDGGGRSQLVLQFQSVIATLCVGVLVLYLGDRVSVAVMLVAFGASKLAAGGPAVIRDSLSAARSNLAVEPLRSLLVSRPNRRRSAWITLVQIGNAVTGALDTLIVGLSGSMGVANYQLALRPMQGLSVLNGAVGQMAFNANAGAEAGAIGHTQVRAFSLWCIPLWALFSVPAFVFAKVTAPSGSSVEPLVFLGLGVAGGFGAVAALMGPSLIVLGRTVDVVGSSMLQMAMLAVFGLFGVMALGYSGVVLGVVAGRFGACAYQYWRLRAASISSTMAGAVA